MLEEGARAEYGSFDITGERQQELEYSGETILEEEIDMTTNVKRLSSTDKADLKQLLKDAKKRR